MVIQNSYSINPNIGFPGTLAEPNSPTRVERGRIHLASGDPRMSSGQTGARPGDALYWDTGTNAWRVPHSAATLLRVEAILTYPADTVASTDSIVRYVSGAEIELVTMGVVWVVAGGAVERSNQLQMQMDDWKYDNVSRVTAIADMLTNPVVCFSASGADNGIIKAAIGYGRAI